jgi:regulator of protease activity HflC (stomatin/prohibitin superfamily)
MKITLSALLIVFGLGLYIEALTWLMNADSDFAPAAGVALVVIGACFAVVILRRLRVKYFAWIRRTFLALVAVLALISLTGCYKVVEPGKVGIRVKQTGGDRGVQDIPLQTGRVFFNPFNEYVLEYPTYVQRAIWTSANAEGHTGNEEISWQSKDGLHFSGDVAVAYQLIRERVPHFYVQFRTDDLDTFTHGFFRDAVRKSVGAAGSDYTAEETNGGKQSAIELKANEELTAYIKPYGVEIRQLAFTAPPRPPAQVKQAIEGKIAAIQDAERVENQKRSSVAEGEKMKAIALATAASNATVNASLTPQLIQWRMLTILGDKWDGRLPQVQGSGNSGLLLNIPAPK